LAVTETTDNREEREEREGRKGWFHDLQVGSLRRVRHHLVDVQHLVAIVIDDLTAILPVSDGTNGRLTVLFKVAQAASSISARSALQLLVRFVAASKVGVTNKEALAVVDVDEPTGDVVGEWLRICPIVWVVRIDAAQFDRQSLLDAVGGDLDVRLAKKP
jgi:hypothetical protein